VVKDLTEKKILRNIVSGVTGVTFGLIVGVIPLLDSGYLAELSQLEFYDYLVLFILGIGIGNLHEAIAKIWEKPNEEEE
jgi:thiamine transporter ThiT